MLKTNSKHIHVSIPDWIPKITFLDFDSLGISSEDDLPDYLPDEIQDGTYFKLDKNGDIVGLTTITTESFCGDDEDYLFEEDDDDLIVDVDYVAELLQGLEPQELNYISKVCELLIAEGEL